MAAKANLWLKFDPFHIGALQVSPHPKLSLHYLRKVAVYAKTKGRAGFPNLSFPVWRHIAVNKLNISDDLAWMFFEGYDLLCECPAETRLKLAEKAQSCKTPEEKEFLKSQASVDTLEFLLYLFLQQVHRISLRSSLVAGDEWPMRPRSPDVDTRGGNLNSKSLDENTHMAFVLAHLNDMLSLLVEADPYAGSATDVLLSLQAVQSMSFLLEGSVDGSSSVKPVHELAKMQSLQQKSGFSKITLAFTCRTFESWVRTCLVANPCGVAACISSGNRLSWPTAGGDGEAVKRGRMATNAQKAPASSKLVVLSQICKQTLAKSSSTLVNARVKIHRCHHAFIYLMSPLKFVSIEKCRHSTIVLGVVDTAVHLSGCEDTKVIAATRRCSLSGSTLCTLHLLTPTRPLLLGGNDSITLAPYHTHYPMLQQHMAAIGLGTHPNVWDQPLCIGPDHQDDSSVFELMKPEDFFTFVIPFEMPGETKEIPGGLPLKYERALKERNGQIQTWQQMVKEAGLSPSKRKQFQTLVESRFQAWLDESGHKRELDSLVPTHTSLSK
ncbi:TBCC domain-containing protein 1-like isoform X2 [Asterias amurensis]|uniref:TBCC domain-containing protein 1-like isoform X2 n=1 Tax=Asterias amurensis TaxID=7602 RepID=UPI003AB51DE4